MNHQYEFLDYCRVKKIFEKGFGFLTSIYYKENVFFHFSKIKDEKVRAKLEKLKRGEVYLFYTSESVKGKRRTEKIWLDLKDVDAKLIPAFILRIIEEFGGSKINIFELAHVVFLLREAKLLNSNQFEKILRSKSVRKIPSSVKSMLSADEKERIDNIEELINNVAEEKNTHDEFVEVILKNV